MGLLAIAGAVWSTSANVKPSSLTWMRPRVYGCLWSSGLLSLVVALTGCVHRVPTPPAPTSADYRLELAGEYEVPRGTTVGPDRLPVGGISGLARDEKTGVVFGICDSSTDPRVFVLDVKGEGTSLRVGVLGLVRLGSGSDAPRILDPEGIALAPTSELLISSEGDGDREPRVPPALLAYDRAGGFRRPLPVPGQFLPTAMGPLAKGVRRNEAFESLTITPDGSRLITGSESPLVQDGPPATGSAGALTRLLEYVREGTGDWKPARQFAYPLDPIALGDLKPTSSINGLVEMIALGQTELLALERSAASEGNNGRQLNRIRLYRVSLAGATDISTIDALTTSSGVTPAAKHLILDLADVKGLSPALAGLDNFEGMTFGPRLRDGSRSLLLVSDDNFSLRQHTAFLLFRLVPATRALTGGQSSGGKESRALRPWSLTSTGVSSTGVGASKPF